MNECVEQKLECIDAKTLEERTYLSPIEINDAIDYLESIGAISVERTIGTYPFNFALIRIEGRGRYLYHEIKELLKSHPKKRLKLVRIFLKDLLIPLGLRLDLQNMIGRP